MTTPMVNYMLFIDAWDEDLPYWRFIAASNERARLEIFLPQQHYVLCRFRTEDVREYRTFPD